MGFPVRHEDSSLSDTDNISLLAIEALTFLHNNKTRLKTLSPIKGTTNNET